MKSGDGSGDRTERRYLATALAMALLSGSAGAGVSAGDRIYAQASSGVSEGPTGATADLDLKTLRALDDDDKTVRWNELTVDEIEKMKIVDRKGSVLGNVGKVLADPNGKIVAVTARVGGIIFGIGATEVVVPLDQLDYDQKRFATTMSSEQLEALPRWERE